MSTSNDAHRCRRNGPLRAFLVAFFAVFPSLVPVQDSRAVEASSTYWLKYGKPARLCSNAQTDTPAKIEGASWGVIASGVILCRDLGTSYAIKLDFLNVRIDPADRNLLKRKNVVFDWFGLALYRPSASDDVEWLFDSSQPVKGELRKDSSGRIVFSNLSFVVPKQQADGATNMLFYLTFDGPVVAIRVL